jgi:hypothetical protein
VRQLPGPLGLPDVMSNDIKPLPAAVDRRGHRRGVLLYNSAMSFEQLRLDVEKARQHVVRAREIVEAQRGLIERMRLGGHAVASHEMLLTQFESTLAIFEQHEQHLLAELRDGE